MSSIQAALDKSALDIAPVDMGLDRPRVDRDHTYAVQTLSNAFSDLVNKDKQDQKADHTYSFCSKGSRNKMSNNALQQSARSSSQEELHKSRDKLAHPSLQGTTLDDLSLRYLKCQIGETPDSSLLRDATSKQLCSRSWPRENMFAALGKGADFDLSSDQTKTVPPVMFKPDHTYARHHDRLVCQCNHGNRSSCASCTEKSLCSTPVFKTDHTYDKNRKPSTGAGHIRESKLRLQNNRCDHNYSGIDITAQGSVESLDMDHSDTDSCEETEVEERKIAITSSISAWLQLRKDHPYSSI